MDYRVRVDVGDDGSYGLTLTDSVLAAEWRLGMRKPYDLVAGESRAVLTLRNVDRAYSPEVSPAILRVGRRVAIEYGTPPRRLFTGFIRRVAPTTGTQGARQTVVEVVGAEPEYEQMRILLPLQVGVRADEVLATVFDLPPLTRIPRRFSVGLTTLAYVGDLWGAGVRVARAIEEVVEAERGRFFYNREGEAVMLNRHEWTQTAPPTLTIHDAMAALTYDYGGAAINTVRVQVRPRGVGSPDSVLWRLNNAQLIRPGERVIVARMTDASGNRIGALSVTPPVAYTDYRVNEAADGSSTDLTIFFQFEIVEVGGSAVKIRVTNPTQTAGYLQPGAQIRGTPLFLADSVTVTQEDTPAQNQYGVRTLALALPALDSIEEAHQLAAFELNRRVVPAGAALTLTLDERHLLADALSLTLFDRVRIQETQTGHDRTYFIVAEAHHITQGGYRHQVVWTLEPVPPLPAWQLNVSLLSTSTALAY